MVSGLAPGSDAEMLMVGKSTLRQRRHGKQRKRRHSGKRKRDHQQGGRDGTVMNGAEMFMAPPLPHVRAARLLVPVAPRLQASRLRRRALTLTPGFKRYWPLTTTRSPDLSPLLTTVMPSTVGPPSMGRFSAVLSASITQASNPCEFRCTAPCGIDNRIFQHLDQHARPDELAGPQPLVLIGERRLEPDRARGLVDLIVDQQQLALAEFVHIVLIHGDDRDLTLRHGVLHVCEVALRQSEAPPWSASGR